MTDVNDLLKPGTVVETTFGVGVVVSHRGFDADATTNADGTTPPMVEVQLWRQPGHSIGTATSAFLQPSAIKRRLPVAPGMTTMTIEDIPKKVLIHSYNASQDKYLVSYADEEDAAAVAAIMPHLQRMMNDMQIAAADDDNDDEFFDAEESTNGPLVLEEEEAVVPDRKPVVLLSYTAAQLQPTKSAKFYPLLLELMKRGDRAVAQAGGLWLENKDKLQEAAEKLQPHVEKIGGELQEKAKQVMEGTPMEKPLSLEQIEKGTVEATTRAESAVDSLKANIQEQTPSQEEVQKVMTMLKDEEFTVLLENGKQRLEQLVQSDIPKATEQALKNLGIVWNDATGGGAKTQQLGETQQKALKAVDELLASIQQAAEQQGIDLGENKLSLEGLNVEQLGAQFQELHLEEKFKDMFDGFVEASKSDRRLSSIMEQVSTHTTEWQQMTGRLLATKSGSLFLEGASRIQARAGLILSGGSKFGQNVDLQQWTQSMTTKFTKAFTEGDAAVARLKTIELGDAVRHRLVSAIEIRSDSLGGLDGIIARALGTLETQTKQTAKNIQNSITQDNISQLLANLQTSADGKKKEAHETLISVLSSKSIYRDIALLKLERTFCELEEQFFGAEWNSEDAWSAEDLAALARGEGGTAKLFEPIAKRAKQEIDKQLDNAEAAVKKQQESSGGEDKNAELMMEALTRVRKIMSGELTVNAIVEDVVTLLNDDKIVAQGENLIQRGERLLDAIENASNMEGNINDPTNRLVSDAMKVAQKAGITKDSVMAELEKINVDEILDTAQGAVTDEKKRLLLLSQATDTALDFFLKILPSMPVPPFEGVKDGLVYHLSNLSLEGFVVKKENIVMEIAGMRATTDISKRKSTGPATMAAMKKAVKNMPKEATAGTPIAAPESAASFLAEDDSTNDEEFQEAELDITTTSEIGHVKATELLIIDISDIAAVLDGATWSFEQTYFPYLKGKGKSDVRLVNGCVRLQFELRKRKQKIQVPKVGGEDGETEQKEVWEPVLCLHDRSCTIGEVFVSLQGEGKMAWILNKLADFFKGPVGTYVARQIVAVLSNKSGFILDKLNNVLAPYWDLILSTAGLKMDDLVEADHRVVTAADAEDNENTIELVWRERLPLGLNLLLNDESGQVKVVDLPRGSQARKVCEARQLDPEGFKGATIVAVNGCRFFEPEEVYDALRDPIRPKTVLFELAESAEAKRVQEFVASAMDEKERKIKEAAMGASPVKAQADDGVGSEPDQRTFKTHSYEITEPGDLGIEFGESPDNFGLVVCSFVKNEDGSSQAAESSGKIQVNDLLTHINGKLVLGENGAGRERAFEILQAEGSARPLSLSFVPPYLIQQVFEASPTDNTASLGGPKELCLEEIKDEETGKGKRIVLSGFNDTDGVAESTGILIGDYLVFINGESVGAGTRWLGEGTPPTLEEVYGILRDRKNYPMGLTFARPKQVDNNASWSFRNNKQTPPNSEKSLFTNEESETVAVCAERLELLGCVFDVEPGTSDVVVTDFHAVPGFFQNSLSPVAYRGGRNIVKLAIESINGQFVPSYASKDMVMSAMKRSWSKDRRVELLMCDDECKAWVHSLVASPSPEADQ